LTNIIPLGRIFGIRIGLHRWVPLLALVAAFFLGGANLVGMSVAVLLIVGLFGLVLLHELGHSIVARHHGIRVSQITLWPLGGVAWMEDIPEDSRVEAQVAVAGPAVNLVLATLAAPLLLVPGVAPLAQVFVWMNLMLGLFNLVPAFPMDGGRVLRAFFGRKGDWLEATEKAVRVGRVVAIAGGIVAFFAGFWLAPILAVYILAMGQRELFAMRAKKLGEGFPFGAFAEAVRRAQAGQPASSPFGFEAPGSFDASEVDAQAPTSRRDGQQGFSEEEIARLERYRGRMPRDWDQVEE